MLFTPISLVRQLLGIGLRHKIGYLAFACYDTLKIRQMEFSNLLILLSHHNLVKNR